jgi:hypothetical protein
MYIRYLLSTPCHQLPTTYLPETAIPCQVTASTQLLLDVGQLQTVFRLQYTMMKREYMPCHDKVANIAFREQSEEFELAQPRSVQTFKFDHFSPISFVSQIHILRGHIGEVYDHGLISTCSYVQCVGYLYSPAGAYSA